MKKIVLMVMAVCLVLVLSACNSNNKMEDKTMTDKTMTDKTMTEKPAANEKMQAK